MPREECQHGSLKRQCEICERDARIAKLEDVLGVARGVIRDAHEIAVRRGANTWWEPMEKRFREAHDDISSVLDEMANPEV